MTDINTNKIDTIPIDSTGQFAVEVGGSQTHSQIVGLKIEGDESADYEIYHGGPKDDGTIKWFDGGSAEQSYTGVQHVSDSFELSVQYIRIDVTTAATTSGSEARVYVSWGG